MTYSSYGHSTMGYRAPVAKQQPGYDPFSLVNIYWLAWLVLSLVFSFAIGFARIKQNLQQNMPINFCNPPGGIR